MTKNTLNGYKPSLWSRIKYNFGQGFKIIKSNYKSWLTIIKDEDSLFHIFFWEWLTSKEVFSYDKKNNSFLPLREYTWLYEFLKQENFYNISIGGYAPFTIEAEHSSGINLYFRSRCSTSLRIYIGDFMEAYEDNGRMLKDIDILGGYMNDESEVFQSFYYHYSDIRYIFGE